MSNATPTCNSFSIPPIQTGGDMLHFQHREHQTLSHNEHPSLKKQRVCEAPVLNPRTPVMSNNVMTPNLVNKPLNGTWNADNNAVAEMEPCRLLYYKGKCKYGNRCRFYHVNPEKVEQDLGRLTPNLVNKPLHGTWNADNNAIAKLEPCRLFYYKGMCTYGDGCRFYHVNPEKDEQDLGRLLKSKSAVSTGTSSGCSGDQRSGYGQFASKEFGDGVNSRSEKWKTKLCWKWEKTGGCRYGKTCYFAHGQAEVCKLEGHNELASRIVQTKVSNTFSTGNDQSGTTCKKSMQCKSCGFKRKKLGKIRGIYADWIEDAPPSS